MLPRIEIADSRIADWRNAPPAAALADLALAGAWVHGAPCHHWRELDLPTLPVRLGVDGKAVGEGSGAQPFGGPLDILATYIADLGRQQRHVRAGELVSTGSCAAPHFASAGERVVADFGPLGQASVHIV